jgi:hypothetical protein
MTPTDQLRSAVVFGDAAAVRALLSDGRADPGAGEYSVLIDAVQGEQVEVLRALLDDGRADPCMAPLALMFAARDGRVDGRADPAECGNITIRRAAWEGHAAVVDALLADGRARTQPGATTSPYGKRRTTGTWTRCRRCSLTAARTPRLWATSPSTKPLTMAARVSCGRCWLMAVRTRAQFRARCARRACVNCWMPPWRGGGVGLGCGLQPQPQPAWKPEVNSQNGA